MAANEDRLNLENFRVLLNGVFGTKLEEYYNRELYPEKGAALKEQHLAQWLRLFQQRFSTVGEAMQVLGSIPKAEELLSASVERKFSFDSTKEVVSNVLLAPPFVVKVCFVIADEYYYTADGIATLSFIPTIRQLLEIEG